MTYAARPSGSRSAKEYADIGLETQVLSATPGRLITLLYRGARAAIAQARFCLAQGKIAERGQAISKAIKIIDEGLKAALNKEAGGEPAANLDRLYDYLVRTLLRANLNADDQLLEHVDNLIANLAQAWQTAIDPPPPDPVL